MALSQEATRKRLLVIAAASAACLVVAVVLWRSGTPDVGSGSEQDRVQAIVKIVSERPIGSGSALAEAAEDESPVVRRTALAGLTQTPEPEYRSVIVNALADKDAGVRAIAAEGLGQYDDTEATQQLARLVQADEDASVRKAALRGLVPCDDPLAIVTMIETAGNPSVPKDIRYQAAKSALRKAGGRLIPGRNPDNDALWRDQIQRMKMDQRIVRAYRAAGVPLVSHPEDIIEPNRHGRRDVPQGSASQLAPGKLVEEKKP